jgi:hypothetical protein
VFHLQGSILLYFFTVPGAAAIWGVIAVGLFADNPEPLDTTSGRSGLFKGSSPLWVIG